MRYLFPVLSLLFVSLAGRARGQAAPAPADTARPKTYTYIETMPVFPGLQADDSARTSMQRVMKFLNDGVQYPPRALRDGVAGKVFFSFAVNAQGRTQDIKLVQGLRADVDAEVLRNAHRLDAIQWKPGTQNGRPVTVSFTVPLTFSINGPAGNTQRSTAPADSLDLGPYHKLVLPLPYWGPDRRIADPQKGLVYGSCIQRLGFSSGGFGQYVRLVNLSTGKAFRIEVKPPMRSRKQNAFCYALPAGRYALYTYEFTESKWYGGEMHEENLRKPAANADSGLRATRYLFSVAPGQLHYLGTWNLEQENTPVFADDKALLDAQLTPIFKYLNFARAVLAVPR